jgi:hypothetical protein
VSASILIRAALIAGVAGLAGCATPATSSPSTGEGVPARHFLAKLTPYCGRAFPGRVVEDQPASDDPVWNQPAVLFLRCERDGNILSLSLGEDRSRVWLLGSTPAGLRLSHMHSHPDGNPEDLNAYGGLARDPAPTATRVEFPADEPTRKLFAEHGLRASRDNVWALELADENTLVYELKRRGRTFRMAFDLSRPQTPPPPPWAEMPVR